MEAEHYDSKIPRSGKDWGVETSVAGYSGSGHMRAVPSGSTIIDTNYVTTSPELVYNVQFTTTGTYYLWARGAGGIDDSYHAGIDNTAPASGFNVGNFGTVWRWNSTASGGRPTFVVSTPGLHTIHIWMREDGFPLDKLLLRTNSSTTAPSGTGPAESPRVTVGGDTTPPTGTVSINSGAANTNTTAVTLTLSATDDSGTVSAMQFSNDGTTYSAAEAYATSKGWTLSTGDGTKTVYAKFKDAAGNWSAAATDTITLDTTAPTVSSVNASGITQTAATITWTTNEAATSQVEYGTTTGYGQLTTLDQTLVTSHSVGLSGLTAGTLYHYRVRSKDAAGNERIGTDATFTTQSGGDTTPPTGSVAINGGAAATNNAAVTLTLSATDASGVAQMQFSNDGTSYSTAEAYATTKTWTLTTGDGTKTVYAKFKDAVGNWMTTPASDTIMLDTTPPTIGFLSPQDGDTLTAPAP